MKITKRAVLAGILACQLGSVSAAEKGGDPYIEGFEAYANEVRSYSDVLTEALHSYAGDVAKVEKQAGYIGDVLPIPQAVKVTDGVYTVVGSMIWHNPANFGLNNNLSFVVFKDGVFVFNAGANAALAYSLHQQIKKITDKPVKWVAVENNQGHAYLGASYWYDVGVRNLYSSEMANDQFHEAFPYIKEEWSMRVGRAITRSVRDVSDKFKTFNGEMKIDVGGGEYVLLKDFGPGHTPASTSAYVPSRKLLFTGDLGFNERMPVFFQYTDSYAWQDSYANMLKQIPADTKVVPGHGTPSDMQTIKHQTYDYLVYLHQQVQKVVDDGGNAEEVEQIDQSMYKDRPVFEQAAKPNARHVYRELTGGDF
ncbi:MBL fold metallo-hydrolase [Thiomicrorhabdus heinhorstiae]|uniref:MBL fold metallo-hydrolase n=1 Tax=Thiomicrorhabdus heinhorstiae TaxID=2748010 RepID=A0ABS0C072_9GAMM|nr:MBL fold metallo-hydrolase [Thiomicrorhabdus heinhorstiae]MBF6057646.1 MBL fold metallo-hydrolase [Thiomicrorhabdus heinhorstiae]